MVSFAKQPVVSHDLPEVRVATGTILLPHCSTACAFSLPNSVEVKLHLSTSLLTAGYKVAQSHFERCCVGRRTYCSQVATPLVVSWWCQCRSTLSWLPRSRDKPAGCLGHWHSVYLHIRSARLVATDGFSFTLAASTSQAKAGAITFTVSSGWQAKD